MSKWIQAKLNVTKTKWVFVGTPVKAPADLTAADICKEDTNKAKREKKEMTFHAYPRKKLPLLGPTFSKRIQAKLNVKKKY